MNVFKLSALLTPALLIFSCQPVDPTDPHEEELITTLQLDLDAGSVVHVLNYQDLDGDGGNAPVLSLDTLLANTTYSGSIRLFNESETPAEEFTAEVFDEAEEHQFFFSASGNSSFAYIDQDNNGFPVGLAFELVTGEAGSEILSVTLRHQPDKGASGVSDGDITNAGGETDIEVLFDVIIE